LVGHDCAWAWPAHNKAMEANKPVRCRREMDGVFILVSNEKGYK
jgi:hypothetical protein